MYSLQEISDKLEISELLTRYCNAIDSGNWEELDSVFCKDAYIDYSAMGAIAGSLSEIKEFLAKHLPGLTSYQHMVSNITIDITGDSANVRSICHNPFVVGTGSDESSVVLCGLWYRDVLVRTQVGWRIQERVEERCYISRPVKVMS